MPIIAGRASAAYGAGFGKVLGGAAFAPVGAFDALSTVIVPVGGLSTITFAGIPQTGYSHLQIREISKTTSGTDSGITINDGTVAVYRHHVAADGSGISSFNASASAFIMFTTGSAGTSIFSSSVVDFLDYSSSIKTKTVRSFSGRDLNGSGFIGLASALFNTTNPITSITLTPGSGNFAQHTQFALYGVK
jgi:hypothetical protein